MCELNLVTGPCVTGNLLNVFHKKKLFFKLSDVL